MKKTLLILSFILVSVASFAQRQRTTAMFDSDTTTRPKAGFYGIGVRANNIYFVPPTGNNIRLANYSLFTGLTNNYLIKWNDSKLVNSGTYDDGVYFSMNTPILRLTGSYASMEFNGSHPSALNIGLRNFVGGVSNSGFEIYDNTNSASRLAISSSGNVGIGTASPTSKLQVVGLPTYADNTAATIGGLTVGAFYRTVLGVLMVVY